jgi:membrane protease YdiL (CAAX protease family)
MGTIVESQAPAGVRRRSPWGLRVLARRHPVASYFGLAYAVSWAGVLLVTAPGGIPAAAERVGALLPLVFLAMAAGPPAAAVCVTALVDGRDGLRALRDRLGRWRVGARWYAVALLTAPGLLLAALFPLALASPAFLPGLATAADRRALVAVALAGGLGAGLAEETGWTGFATPRLLRRHGVLATGLLVGVLWWGWHVLADYWGGAGYGAWYGPHVLLWAAALPAYRVLMTWVYRHTGSVLVAALMHAGFTGGQALLLPGWTTGAAAVLAYGAFALALWAAVAAVAVAGRGGLVDPAPEGSGRAP